MTMAAGPNGVDQLRIAHGRAERHPDCGRCISRRRSRSVWCRSESEYVMTTVLTPKSSQPPPDERRPGASVGVFESFDLLDRIGLGIAKFAGVEPPVRSPSTPRLDAALLRRAGAAIAHNRTKRTGFLVFASLVLAFSAAVAALLATGVLAAYGAIWSRFPGSPWTHVMRDHPWIYAGLAVMLSVVPFLLAPRGRWGRRSSPACCSSSGSSAAISSGDGI